MSETETSQHKTTTRRETESSNESVDGKAEKFNEYVTETRTREKKFSISINQDNDSIFRVLSHDKKTLASVAGALDEIRDWVNEVNQNGWELKKFKLDTTIVVQRTEDGDEDGD